jgi:hypothetical protein
MNSFHGKCCVLSSFIFCMMASVPVMAADLYLVRLSSGKEVVFELTSRQARLVKDAKWKEVTEIPRQSEYPLLGNYRTPDVENGTARWIPLKELTSSPPSETKSHRFELLADGTVYDRSESRVLVLSCESKITAFTLREAQQELVVLNKQVTEDYELTFIRFTGEVVKRVPIKGMGVGTLFLDGEDTLAGVGLSESE